MSNPWDNLVNVNVGTPNAGNGDTPRNAFIKVNSNTADIKTSFNDIQAEIDTKVDKINITGTTVGSASKTITQTINAQGQVTSAAEQNISIPSTQVSDFSEAAQDAVGSILTGTATIDLTYDDVNNQIKADVKDASITDVKIANGIDATKIANSSVTNAEFQTLSDINTAGTIQAQLNLKAPLASPTFTGSVIVPTPTLSTEAANKDYVDKAVLSSLKYQGTWNASTNTPTLSDGTSIPGYFYRVNVAGAQNLGSGSISFEVGDDVVYNPSGIWEKWDMTDAVSSVFGRTGAITSQDGDYTATQITNTPAGNIASTNVQAAINELDTEKLAADKNLLDVLSASASLSNIGGIGAATTDTLTNKTFDTAGSGNVLKINGTQVSNTTGSGSIALSNSPSLITPILGAASATSVNKVAITQPATGSTLTIADGKTLTSSNTLTLAGTDGSTLNIGTGGTLSPSATTDATNLSNDTIQGTFTPSNSAIVTSDDAKTAFQKAQGQINSISTGKNVKTLYVSGGVNGSGSDSNNGYKPDNAFLTLSKLNSVLGNTGEQAVLLPSQLSESASFSQQNIEITGQNASHRAFSGTSGIITSTNTTASQTYQYLTLGAFTKTGAGSAYLKDVSLTGAFTDSSNGYCEAENCIFNSTLSITGSGTKVMNNISGGALTINNVAVVVSIITSNGILPFTLTNGLLSLTDAIVYVPQGTTFTIGASGTIFYATNVKFINATDGTIAKINIPSGSFYSLQGCEYDVANSTLNGTDISLTRNKFFGYLTAKTLNLSAATASTIAIIDSSKNLVSASTATYPSLTELSYIKGLASSAQTQINAKLAISSNLLDVANRQTSLNNLTNTAGATTDQVLTFDGTNALFKTPTGGSGSSVSTTITQSNSFTVGQWITFLGGSYILADASNTTKLPSMGVVTAATSTQFTYQSAGIVTGLSGLIANSLYCISDVTPGAIIAAPSPATTGQLIQNVLYATSTTGGQVMLGDVSVQGTATVNEIAPISFTPVITATTTNPTLPTSHVKYGTYWISNVGGKRVMHINFSFYAASISGGVNGVGAYLFDIPNGEIADTTIMQPTSTPLTTGVSGDRQGYDANTCGIGVVNRAGGNYEQTIVILATSTKIAMVGITTSTVIGSSLYGMAQSNNLKYAFTADIPLLN